MELYEERLTKNGKFKSDLLFTRDVLLLFRPGIISILTQQNNLIYQPMLKNYLLIALRNARSHKWYAIINIAGLTLGIVVTVLLLLFVAHELSYDDFHTNKHRVYRINAELKYGEQVIHASAMSAGFGPVLKNEATGVENYVRLRQPGRVVVQSQKDSKYFEDRFIFSDSSFFSIFSFQLLEGNKQSLGKPGKVFITPSIALKYFGSGSVIGHYITYEGKTQLEIAGIVAPAPSNSSLQYDFIASFATLELLGADEVSQYKNEHAALGSYPTYLQLQEGTQTTDVEKTIARVVKDSVNETYTLQPLKTLPENINQLIIFSSVAILVLILALVNYMNLTTARATTRAKEVGLRKVAGATRSMLASQFYIESAAMTIFSFATAYLIIVLTFPFVRQWIGINISTAFLSSPQFFILVFALLAACVFLAGSYPALVLSAFKPASVLKGQQSRGSQGAWIRKGLTTFQFGVSMVLIFASIIIQNQLTFLRNREIGINKEQVLVVKTDNHNSSIDFYNQVSTLSTVKEIGQATVSLFKDGMSGYFTKAPTTHEDVFIQVMTVDEHFFSTLNIPFHHQAEEGVKPGNVIVNQTGLDELKIKEVDMGVTIDLGKQESKIMGVVKDFNFASLKQKIAGMLFIVAEPIELARSESSKSMYIRLNTDNLNETVQQIRTFYEAQKPNDPFEFYFLDDAFNQLYYEEEQMARLFQVFTALAITVACLGLFGLVTFTTERKTHEIGIRKVLGASEVSIVHLITKEFTWVIVVGCLCAVPIGWWLMQSWLNNFSYRIKLEVIIFIISAGVIISMGLLTVAIQAVQAARNNPVKSLRSE